MNLKLINESKTTVYILLVAVMIMASSWRVNANGAIVNNTMPSANEVLGLQIATERSLRDSGWQDSSADMNMDLINNHGDTITRYLKVKSLEVENDGDKSLTVFKEPRDLRNTAFLTFSHVEGADDQWLFIPSLKRVKRISTQNKSSAFMGSEFSYEDLGSFEIEKYRFNYLKDERIAQTEHYVVEAYPLDENSGYLRTVSWLEKDRYIVSKIEYYDRNNQLLKTQLFSDYKLYLSKFWRANQSIMENHLSGKKTRLTWNDFQFSVGLKEQDFNTNALRRAH